MHLRAHHRKVVARIVEHVSPFPFARVRLAIVGSLVALEVGFPCPRCDGEEAGVADGVPCTVRIMATRKRFGKGNDHHGVSVRTNLGFSLGYRWSMGLSSR
jgi:hypothetical protein